MSLTPLTEADIIDQIYSAYENDSDTWSTTSAEYLTARRLCKAAIIRWEYLEGVRWSELITDLEDASDGTKTTTAGDYDYSCPTDMRIPPRSTDEEAAYVRILDSSGNSSKYIVIPLSKRPQLDNSSDRFCYFTGNPKLGYTLNFNPNLSLSTGGTIKYEYIRTATYFTSASSSTEMSNPFFIVHYVLHRLFKNDGQLSEAGEELQIAETLLQEMKAESTSVIEDSDDGFGV